STAASSNSTANRRGCELTAPPDKERQFRFRSRRMWPRRHRDTETRRGRGGGKERRREGEIEAHHRSGPSFSPPLRALWLCGSVANQVMNMIRTLIVDDEELARKRLRRMLAPFGDVEVVGEAENGAEAVTKIESERPDLVFLDVQMPDL